MAPRPTRAEARHPHGAGVRGRRRCGLALLTALLASGVNGANAFDVAHYLEAASQTRSKGGVNVTFPDSALRLRAGLDLKVADGYTRAAPQLNASYPVTKKLVIENNVGLRDWNRGITLDDANVDTLFRIRDPARFVDRLDYRIKHLANGVAHDTSVFFSSPVDFLNQIQGTVRQAPNGTMQYSLNLGFRRTLSAPGAEMPLTLTGKAAVETKQQPHRRDISIVRMETVLTGLAPRGLVGLSHWRSTTRNKLVLRYEKRTGGQRYEAAVIEYDHSWAVRANATIDLSLRLQETTTWAASSLNLNWESRF